MIKRLGVMGVLMSGVPAWAEAPQVAVDIAPLHGLVARVMQGAGAPDLILPPGASPHGYSMRPSEAAALQKADIVFNNGAGLTPWLEESVETLAADARIVTVMTLPQTKVLEFREEAAFGQGDDHGAEDHAGHDHAGHDDEKHAEHEHDDHAEHEHDAHAGHDEDKYDDHAGHDHSGIDPHGWMDPANAVTWSRAIAEVLAETDAENAALYRQNAEAAIKEIDAVSATVQARLSPHAETGFVVFHDAYQYFETAFGLRAIGALALSDATEPGAARVAEIQQLIKERGVVCVFAEPQFSAGLVSAVVDGSGAREAVLDPLGTQIAPGAGFYPAFLTAMGDAMAGCFEAGS